MSVPEIARRLDIGRMAVYGPLEQGIIGALALVGFEGLDLVASLLQRAGDHAANCVFQTTHLVPDLGQRGAVLRARPADTAAASVLLKLMVDPATPATGRIRPALGIFGLSREALDLEIETRVSALERMAEVAKSNQT